MQNNASIWLTVFILDVLCSATEVATKIMVSAISLNCIGRNIKNDAARALKWADTHSLWVVEQLAKHLQYHLGVHSDYCYRAEFLLEAS